MLLGAALMMGAAIATVVSQGGEAVMIDAQAKAQAPSEPEVSTSIEGLRGAVGVPGDPLRVWFTHEPVPMANADQFPPGPRDHRWFAVLEYEASGEVEALLVGTRRSEARLPTPDWLPEALAGRVDGGELIVERHGKRGVGGPPVIVDGVARGEVYTVPGAPRFLILRGTTT